MRASSRRAVRWGVNLLRRLYFAAIETAVAGGEPVGVVREPIVRFDNVF